MGSKRLLKRTRSREGFVSGHSTKEKGATTASRLVAGPCAAESDFLSPPVWASRTEERQDAQGNALVDIQGGYFGGYPLGTDLYARAVGRIGGMIYISVANAATHRGMGGAERRMVARRQLTSASEQVALNAGNKRSSRGSTDAKPGTKRKATNANDRCAQDPRRRVGLSQRVTMEYVRRREKAAAFLPGEG